jgi:hypothetical protein
VVPGAGGFFVRETLNNLKNIVSGKNDRGMKMADQWFLNEFECDCGLRYWFEVTEMEVAAKAAPAFPEVRDYLYYCKKCAADKMVFYTAGDIRP